MEGSQEPSRMAREATGHCQAEATLLVMPQPVVSDTQTTASQGHCLGTWKTPEGSSAGGNCSSRTGTDISAQHEAVSHQRNPSGGQTINKKK